jgi:hypothetical protein
MPSQMEAIEDYTFLICFFLTHILFVNDVMIFGEGSQRELDDLKIF